MPKGGWYSQMHMHLDEHTTRILHALIGFIPSAALLGGSREPDAIRKLLNGDAASPCDPTIYQAFHAVAASVFCRMAVFETGPEARQPAPRLRIARRLERLSSNMLCALAQGRARSAPLNQASVNEFAENRLIIPRAHVVELVYRAASGAHVQRLLSMEAWRVKSDQRLALVLLEGVTVGGQR